MVDTPDVEYCNPYHEEDPHFWMRIEHLARYMYAAELIKKRNAQTVLDVACADGYGCFEIAPNTAKVIGLDQSEELIKLASNNKLTKNMNNVEFHTCDLETENISAIVEDSVDFITSFETIEHLENPFNVLKQFYHQLERNGWLLLSVPNAHYEPITKDGKPRNPHHKQLFTAKTITELVKETGLHVTSVWGQPYTNTFFNRERQLVNRGEFNQDFVNTFYKTIKRDQLRYFSRLFAWPDKNHMEDSYSIIVLAQKHK